MIATSRIMKGVAVTFALALHGTLALALFPRIEVEMEGASGSPDVRLGTSFTDMAAGTLQAETATTIAETIPPAEAEHAHHAEPQRRAEAALPEATEMRVPTELVVTQQTLRVETTRPADTTRPSITTSLVGPAPIARAEQSASTAEADIPSLHSALPERLAALPAPAPSPATGRAAPPAEVEAALRAEQPSEPALSPAPPEALTSDDNPTAVVRSPQPPARNPEIVARYRQAEAERRQAARQAEARRETELQQQAAARAQGNAHFDARAGQATGTDQASATSRGAGGESQETGNADASNYPGEVMRKLARVRRPSISVRGVAVVAFHVADNGDLAGLTIARSSGSPRLDQAALAIVQGAAPFPPPPQGAQRSFSIDIVGR